MVKKILALGFRVDAVGLQNDLESTVAKYGLGVQVIAKDCKGSVKAHLDKHAAPLAGRQFPVNLGNDYKTEPEQWPQYQSDEIKLFVCSTVTREDTSEYATARYDGAEFAKLLLPETHKLILHFRNEYRGDSALPNPETLETDFGNKVYHLPRDLRGKQKKQTSIMAMDNLVKELFERDMKIPLEVYISIINSVLRR